MCISVGADSFSKTPDTSAAASYVCKRLNRTGNYCIYIELLFDFLLLLVSNYTYDWRLAAFNSLFTYRLPRSQHFKCDPWSPLS